MRIKQNFKIVQVAFFMLLAMASAVKAENVHVAVAGTLPQLLADKQNTVTELTLTGELNGTDFIFIRNMGALVTLDMGDARIVAGGDAYYGDYKTENDRITYALFCKWWIPDFTMPVEKIVLPRGITYISYSTFAGLGSLKEVVIPEGVTEIAADAFNATGLTSVTLPTSLEVIGADAFAQIWNLKSLHLPKNVREIGRIYNHRIEEFTVDADNVFFTVSEGLLYSKDMTRLYWVPKTEITHYTLPEGLKRIEPHAFPQLGVETVDLPQTLEEIGAGAFAYSGLTSISLPASIRVIEHDAFDQCPITSLLVASENEVFTAVDNVLFTKNMEELLFYSMVLPQEKYEVPNGVKTIARHAFFHQQNLKSIRFPEGLRAIGETAFYDNKLEEIKIPDSCIEITGDAFNSCHNLKKVVLSSSLQTFSLRAFAHCESLTELHCRSFVPYSLYEDFDNGEVAYSSCTLYVPVGAADAYSAADGWKNFTSIEEETVAVVSGDEATVVLQTAGTLSSVLGRSMIGLRSLTIQGPINGDDVECFREGISTENYTSTLQVLDLRKANIVDGGSYGAYPGVGSNEATRTNVVTKCMFQFMKGLLEIYLPETVTVIEERAFQDCDGLKKVVLNEVSTFSGDHIFDTCLLLEELHIASSSVPTSDNALFTDGTDVTKATLYVPFNSKTAYQAADEWKSFGNIREVANVKTAGTLASILGDRAVTETELWVAGELNGTDIKTLQGMTELVSLDMTEASIVPGGEPYFEERMTEKNVVGSYFFGTNGELPNLISLKLPNGVVCLSNQAFWEKRFVDVRLPDALQSIGNQAFENCPLTAVHIPAKVNYIELGAFGVWRRAVKTFTVAEENAYYKAEDGVLYTKDGKKLHTYPQKEDKKFTVHNGIEEICYEAFSSNDFLETVSLPTTINKIGYRAFWSCSSLKNIDLSSTSVVDLEFETFDGCNNFSSILFPATLRSIGGYCFRRCNSLNEFEVPEGVTFIGESCFSDCSLLNKIVIPKSVTNVEPSLFNNTSIGSVIWNASDGLKTAFSYRYWNSDLQQDVVEERKPQPNTLLYVGKDTSVPEDWKNVIRDGVAEEVVLQDTVLNEWGNPEYPRFFAAQPFKAKSIRYVRAFNRTASGDSYESGRGESGGWQTLVLPFTPNRIYHEAKGELAPFNSGVAGARPFWLRKLATNGFVSETVIEPNQPYIVSMPNHSTYDEQYNIVGEVTFSAESADGIDVPATPETLPVAENDAFRMLPTYDVVYSSYYHGLGKEGVYCLNEAEEYIEGKQYRIGSVFMRDRGMAAPFSAYVESKVAAATAPLYYAIGGEGGGITGLEDILRKEDESLKIYTIDNVLYIDSDRERNISIYDVTGRAVREVEVHEGNNTVIGLPSGFYFLEGKKVAIK